VLKVHKVDKELKEMLLVLKVIQELKVLKEDKVLKVL
jgi:hypothetical protein